jgi:hypothetical protein
VVQQGGKGPEYGKGIAAVMPRVCFGCGATDHIIRDCPKNPMKIQTIEQDKEEILLIENVQDDLRHIPIKVKIDGKKGRHGRTYFLPKISNRFRVFQEGEMYDEDVVCFCRAVSVEHGEANESGAAAFQPSPQPRTPHMGKVGVAVGCDVPHSSRGPGECKVYRADIEDHRKVMAEQVS